MVLVVVVVVVVGTNLYNCRNLPIKANLKIFGTLDGASEDIQNTDLGNNSIW